MTTSNSPAAAWHTDPSGRHQFRWWDGTRWTDQVADNGVVGVEALPPPASSAAVETGPGAPASPEVAEALLGRSELFFRSGGGNFPPGWWQVTDENREPVAKVWRQRRENMLCDLDGSPVIGASAELRRRPGQSPVEAIHSGEHRIGDLQVVDATGARISAITHIQAKDVSLRCSVGEDKRALTIKIKRRVSGAVKGVVLLDGSKRQVGTITEVDGDGSLLDQGTCWLHLSREPAMVDPARGLAIAAPLLMSSFLYHVNG